MKTRELLEQKTKYIINLVARDGLSEEEVVKKVTNELERIYWSRDPFDFAYIDDYTKIEDANARLVEKNILSTVIPFLDKVIIPLRVPGLKAETINSTFNEPTTVINDMTFWVMQDNVTHEYIFIRMSPDESFTWISSIGTGSSLIKRVTDYLDFKQRR